MGKYLGDGKQKMYKSILPRKMARRFKTHIKRRLRSLLFIVCEVHAGVWKFLGRVQKAFVRNRNVTVDYTQQLLLVRQML
jgi:hypothetical protein